jgi:biopolymer transport protein ExbB
LTAFVFTCLLALVGAWVVGPALQPAFAQEEGAAAPAEGEPKAAPTEGRSNLFMHIIRSAGPVFGPLILLMSIVLVALIVLLAMDLRMGVAIPPAFVEEFTDTINKRRFKEAFELARQDTSFLGRVMTTGMGRLQYGLEDAREAALNTLDAIKGSKERWNNYLAVIASLGPLLGLVGTVYGMIGAFKALGGGENKNASLLADSIAHALAVTLIGIAIAVPALALNTFFRNRINQVTMDVGHVADDLLTQMFHNSKKPAPAASTPAAPAVAAPVTPPAQPPR